jgi:CheY-like chemotaxis protein
MTPKQFILVDDDDLCNLLTRMTIERNFRGSKVTDFLVPELALTHIEAEFSNNTGNEKVIVFLDINMPTMSGWEFLGAFDKFPTKIKEQFRIYVLSSSIDPADTERAKLNPHVVDFIEKPVSVELLSKMIAE